MRRRFAAMTLTVCLAATALVNGANAGRGTPVTIDAILSALRAIEQKPLWPGFDLARVPIAISDGQHTWLFRHPSPPAEFKPVPGADGLLIADGQHTAVRANSSTNINGVRTATYLAGLAREVAPASAAAIIAHEAFHVYQLERRPDWVTNEMNLFTYPSELVANLADARLEAAALERALAAPDRALAACWAAAALRTRTTRFARLGNDGVAYERGVELVEGTASLVQYRAGGTDQPSISASGLAADATRLRAYASGRTIGVLLDRLAPGWEKRIEAAKAPVLDFELAAAVRGARETCTATRAQVTAATEQASREVAALVARRESMRREFDTAPGWRLLIRALEGSPFNPQGFDPMNVVRVGPTEILHTRFLQAGNDTGFVEVLDHKSLTRAAGTHPIFSGFAEVEITGLADEPKVTMKDAGVALHAGGVVANFSRAVVVRDGQTISIHVGMTKQ